MSWKLGLCLTVLRERHVACCNSMIIGYICNGLEEVRWFFDGMTNYVEQELPQEGLSLLASLYG